MTLSIPIRFIAQLNEADNLEDTLNCITVWLPQLLPAQRASITFANPDAKTLKVFSCHGNNAIPKTLEIPIDSTFAGKVYRTATADIALPDTDPHYDDCKMLSAAGLNTCLDVPLTKSGDCFGTVNIGHSQAGIYTEEDKEFLIHLSQLLAPYLYIYHELTEQTKLATSDELTGLANRRAFLSFANRLMNDWLCDRQRFYILMLDLDFFKQINDELGHAVGDQVLKRFATEINKLVDDNSLFARIGGEEFVIIGQFEIQDSVCSLATQINQAAQVICHDLLPTHIGLSVSIGISASSRRALTLEQILAQADQALYKAKANGRNQYLFA